MTDLYTLILKETKRFLRVWKQTIVPPFITIVLYLMIFGKFLGEKIDTIDGVPYINFIFPGLLMMSVIMASYSNTSSSFFGSKFQKSIEELFVAPIAPLKILCGFVFAAVLRSFFVGCLVLFAGVIMADISVYNYLYVGSFLFFSSVLFALVGLFNGIFAKSFDDIALIPNFVITPLIYLGGVFYSIKMLPDWGQFLSNFNPILYMVNGVRYGFLGISDIHPQLALVFILVCILLLGALNLYLLKTGKGIRN